MYKSQLSRDYYGWKKELGIHGKQEIPLLQNTETSLPTSFSSCHNKEIMLRILPSVSESKEVTVERTWWPQPEVLLYEFDLIANRVHVVLNLPARTPQLPEGKPSNRV